VTRGPRLPHQLRWIPDIAALRISVVVPSFNTGAYLEEALNSAVAQQPPPYEVIIQDGGSTDGSLDILREFGDAIDWRSEPDDGQSDALNRALARATGDVVIWLNADDLLVPGAFTAAQAAFERHPEAEFAYGDFDMTRSDGAIIRRYRSSPYNRRRVFTHGCYIFSGAIFYRRELLERVGRFDTGLHACMDFDYLLRLGDARSIHLGVTVARFRMSGSGKSSQMRSRFLSESHRVRWRNAGQSARLRLLTLLLDAFAAFSIWTQSIRLTRAWSAVRSGKRL
jgi:glycosyltransferase involved in cell wall biosynthesis